MAQTTFMFNGVASTTYGIRLEKIAKWPILPKTRERLLTIATKHGQWDFGPYFDSSTFELDCWIADSSRAALNSALDGIAAWLDPRSGPHPLVRSDYPDRYWNARYSGELSDLQFIIGYASFKLPFLATDPFAHAL